MIGLPVQSAHVERERRREKTSEEKILLSLCSGSQGRVRNPSRESVSDLIYVSLSCETREIEYSAKRSLHRRALRINHPLHSTDSFDVQSSSDAHLTAAADSSIVMWKVDWINNYGRNSMLWCQAQTTRPEAPNEPSKFTSNDINLWFQRWKQRASEQVRDGEGTWMEKTSLNSFPRQTTLIDSSERVGWDASGTFAENSTQRVLIGIDQLSSFCRCRVSLSSLSDWFYIWQSRWDEQLNDERQRTTGRGNQGRVSQRWDWAHILSILKRFLFIESVSRTQARDVDGNVLLCSLLSSLTRVADWILLFLPLSRCSSQSDWIDSFN